MSTVGKSDIASADLDGALLWEPTEERIREANVTTYMSWLREHRNLDFASYDQMWRWSIDDLEAFWLSVWDFFEIQASAPFDRVLAKAEMPGARWFPGTKLNYAERSLGGPRDDVAVVCLSESGHRRDFTFAELSQQVAAVAAELRRVGLKRGDRVVAYMPNIVEALVAFLASASIGAIWSICSPDFGVESVVDRFHQIEPRVFFVADGYQYNGRSYDRLDNAAEIKNRLSTLEATILVSNLHEEPDPGKLGDVTLWEQIPTDVDMPDFEPLPFNHPLWVLYSSGTTGLPKPIVQSHGGILIEHLKVHGFHSDLRRGDRFFWYTTTGWMVWNYVIGGLLLGSSIVLYDGSPAYPGPDAIWAAADHVGATYFGVGAALAQASMKSGIEPNKNFPYEKLRSIGSSGAPLPPEGFKWFYDHVKSDVVIDPVSGGTDVCTAFVGSSPIVPVHAGEIPCRCLGVDVQAWNEAGEAVVDEVGELVVTKPMPSMPLFFWNDPHGSRYRESYFDMFPGHWRHGDWIRITPRGSAVIYGRSDATLNRGGVRMGTSEFYRVVESMPEIVDSLVVDSGRLGKEGRLVLFVVMADRAMLGDELATRIKDSLRDELSPRHGPDRIIAVPEIPRTLNGKKLEVPVRALLHGVEADKAFNQDAMSNPESIYPFLDFATSWRRNER